MSDWRRNLRRTIESVILATALTLVGSVAVQAAHNDNERDNADRAASQAHFWRAVAGDVSTDAPTVENQFAEDLAALSNTELREFRGTSNRYGGLVDQIGFDPFDERGLNCFECGPLDQRTLTNIKLVRSGQLRVVLATVHVDTDNDYTLTPFGWPVWWTVIVYYLLVGHGSYLLVGLFTQPRVRPNDDRWEPNRTMNFVAPFLWAAKVWEVRGERERIRSGVAEKFPDLMALVDSVDRELEAMPEGDEKRSLVEARDAVFDELRRQTRQSERGRDNDRLKELFVDLQGASNQLDARDSALQELDKLQTERPRDPFIYEDPGYGGRRR